MDGPRDRYFGREFAEKLKITQDNEVYEKAGIGDDQGYPALRNLSNSSRALASESHCSAVWTTYGMPRCFRLHERDALQPEFVRGLRRILRSAKRARIACLRKCSWTFTAMMLSK